MGTIIRYDTGTGTWAKIEYQCNLDTNKIMINVTLNRKLVEEENACKGI